MAGRGRSEVRGARGGGSGGGGSGGGGGRVRAGAALGSAPRGGGLLHASRCGRTREGEAAQGLGGGGQAPGLPAVPAISGDSRHRGSVDIGRNRVGGAGMSPRPPS
jgi:hypothetical protein|uniref:Glycine-rich cell wall structural protein 1-like n=1 Tax=Castor canadensis TaxID=51338 RepID=A0A8B7WF83_CASCN|nr:glycine-rich cell wall structural protein 1-like [Castor canadensis]